MQELKIGEPVYVMANVAEIRGNGIIIAKTWMGGYFGVGRACVRVKGKGKLKIGAPLLIDSEVMEIKNHETLIVKTLAGDCFEVFRTCVETKTEEGEKEDEKSK